MLVNLALDCRRFRPVVEGILYRDISLPTPPLDKGLCLFQYPISSTARLARTLTNRLDLAARIKSLSLWFLDRRLVSRADESDLNPRNPYFDVLGAACELMFSHTPLHDEVRWYKELQRYQELDMSAYLIYLIPTLEYPHGLDTNASRAVPVSWQGKMH